MPRCNTEYHWLHQPIFKAINRGYNSIYNSIYSFQGGCINIMMHLRVINEVITPINGLKHG